MDSRSISPPTYKGNAFTSLENDGSEIRKVFTRFTVFTFFLTGSFFPIILISFIQNDTIFAPTVSPFIILIFYIFLSIISISSISNLLIGIFFGSFMFGILLRLEFLDRAPKAWLKSVVYLSFLITIIYLLHIVPFNIVVFPLDFLIFVLLGLFQSVIIFIFLVGFLFLPGLFSAFLPFEKLFGKQKDRTKANAVMYRNFLFLSPDLIPVNEPIKYCPFKDKRKNTCSYLNYPNPKGSLICDYQSTFTRCLAYGRLVQKLKVVVE